MRLTLLTCSFVAIVAAFASPARGTEKGNAQLEGVPLLINSRADGKTGWGAGILLDDDGLVLTNLHVVADAKRLYALLYVDKAPMYTSADGGLSRVVFERERELRQVELVRGDPVNDLAIVRIEGGAKGLRRLRFSSRPLKAGDAVTAIGHPAENLWAFTQGHVGAARDGFIQHDAPLAGGSSGGPLLDVKGEIVGIDTLKLAGEANFSFARPIALAHGLVGDVVAPFALDLSTPDAAARSCARARELASDRLADCVAWEAQYAAVLDVIGENIGTGPQRTRVMRWLGESATYDRFIKAYRPYAIAFEHGSASSKAIHELGCRVTAFLEDASRGGAARPESAAPPPARGPLFGWYSPEIKDALQKANPKLLSFVAQRDEARAADLDKHAIAAYGLKRRLDEPGEIRALLRLGVRVDEVLPLNETRAWVVMTGRNLDKTTYRFSTLWGNSGVGWEQMVAEDRDLHLSAGMVDPRSPGTLGRSRPPSGAPPALDGSPLRALSEVLWRAKLIAEATRNAPGPSGIAVDCLTLTPETQLVPGH